MDSYVKNITVSFPGVVALDNVSINFTPGRIHAVLGANGSGKSTLVKVLTGIYHPDQGTPAEISVDGQTRSNIASPIEAREIGIRVVHQETPLVQTMSVEESIALFKEYPKKKSGLVDWCALRREAQELLDVYDLHDISVLAPINTLSASMRSMVAIAIAVGKDKELESTKLLILDEADASIPESETELFLERVRNVAAKGIAVIMITHRMKEVINECDDVTILTDGKIVYSGTVAEIDEDFLVSKMIRRDRVVAADGGETESDIVAIWNILNRKSVHSGEAPVLEMKDVCSSALRGFNLCVRPGEIVGIAGLPDGGLRDVAQLFMGDIQKSDGEILVCGKPVPRNAKPRDYIKIGLAMMPTDRFRQGGLMTASLLENLRLPLEDSLWHRNKLARTAGNKNVEVFDVRPAHLDADFGNFSGGNQQKAILAKWLQLRPAVMVLDDPTYGVDPAARRKIFSLVKEAAGANVGFVMFSTEPEQFAVICDRVIVVQGGKEQVELKASNRTLNNEAIARWCYA